jgi:AraC-like DNA-binding protein
MVPSLNTWTIIFLVAATQGLGLALLIFLRNSKANNLLALLIASFSVCLLFYVSFWTNYYSLLPPQFGMLMGLTYLFGPLCYFYIRSDKTDAFFNGWHFIPAALYLVYFFSPAFIPTHWIETISTGQTYLQCAHLLIYSYLILRFVSANRGYSNGELKLYTWRKKVAFAFLGYSLSFLLYYVLVWTNRLQIEQDYMISIASSFFIYFIGYHSFQRQEVLRMYEQSKYDKSSLSDSAAISILKELKTVMEKEKPYLDSSLKLPELSTRLKLTQNQISQVINDLEGKNFPDFINSYRIDLARELLLDSSEKRVIEVAYESGFNTKASFNGVFKKFTGMSPSQFKESQLVRN